MDPKIAEKMATPKGVSQGVAQFNKITGELTAVLANTRIETLNTDFFKYREIEMDFDQQEVVGTYDDFKIVNRSDQPQRILEEQLDLHAQRKITNQYPLSTQINTIARVVLRMAESTEIPAEDIKEMMAYLDEVKRVNNVRKQFFQESDDYEYISKDDLANKQKRQLEGGLREATGTPNANGGRVFN